MNRANSAFVLISSLIVSVAACGGEAEGGIADSGQTSASNPPASTGTGSPADAPRPTGETILGSCETGFDPEKEPDRDCAWLAKDLCYSEKVDACACICPRNSQKTFCSSAFYQGPNGRVEVDCF